MFKLVVLVLVLAGWFASSKAFFPAVWHDMSWCIPMTRMPLSWGMIIAVGLLYMTHKSIK